VISNVPRAHRFRRMISSIRNSHRRTRLNECIVPFDLPALTRRSNDRNHLHAAWCLQFLTNKSPAEQSGPP
jgi:hypothetical protein